MTYGENGPKCKKSKWIFRMSTIQNALFPYVTENLDCAIDRIRWIGFKVAMFIYKILSLPSDNTCPWKGDFPKTCFHTQTIIRCMLKLSSMGLRKNRQTTLLTGGPLYGSQVRCSQQLEIPSVITGWCKGINFKDCGFKWMWLHQGKLFSWRVSRNNEIFSYDVGTPAEIPTVQLSHKRQKDQEWRLHLAIRICFTIERANDPVCMSVNASTSAEMSLSLSPCAFCGYSTLYTWTVGPVIVRYCRYIVMQTQATILPVLQLLVRIVQGR